MWESRVLSSTWNEGSPPREAKHLENTLPTASGSTARHAGWCSVSQTDLNRFTGVWVK